MFKTVIAIAAAFAAITVQAFAGGLSADEAKRFVASLEEASALGRDIEKAGRDNALDFDPMPKKGETFAPYSKAVVALKAEMPDQYRQLGVITKKNGFSQESWGAAGDKVIVAYMAEKMSAENPGAMAEMQAMDPAMLDMMPPSMKAQVEGMMAMAQTISDVSPEDRAAVRPVMGDLERFMEAQ